MLPIVARQADAWHAFGSEDSMVRKSRLLDQLAEKPVEIPNRSFARRPSRYCGRGTRCAAARRNCGRPVSAT